MKELAVLERKDLSWSDRVALLSYEISQHPTATSNQDDFGIRHIFKDEWYIREFAMPAGTIFIGRVHKQGHILKLITGEVMLEMEGGRRKYIAPATIHTAPNFIAVCVMLTDIVAQGWFLNPDNCRDVDKLEREYFSDPAEMLKLGNELACKQEIM